MDREIVQSAPSSLAADYQSVPLQEPHRYEEEAGHNASPGEDSTSISDAQGHDNAHTDDAEMPRLPRKGLDWTVVLGDVASVALPIAFIVFATMAACLNGTEAVEPSLGRWNNATTVLGTLFPILLASIVGRFVYEVARWKLEQGVSLGTLEQLLGSQTVGSTVLTQVNLCALNPLTIGLLSIWIFSPLGGQSLLRILWSRLEPVVEHSSVVHFDPEAPSSLAQKYLPKMVLDDTMRNLRNWYSALLLAPTAIKTDGMDLWGNVKIPFLATESDNQGWNILSWSPEPQFFSSFAGYLITDVSMGNSTFSMQTSYLDLNCSKKHRDMARDGYNMTRLGGLDWVSPAIKYQNGTIYGTHCARDGMPPSTTWEFGVDRFVDRFWIDDEQLLKRFGWDLRGPSSYIRPLIFENETGIESKPANLFLAIIITPGGTPEGSETFAVKARCEMKQRYVQSRVSCSRTDATARQNCSVVAQLPSRKRHAFEDISMLSFPSTLRRVSHGLTRAAGESSSGKGDLSMQYLTDVKPTISHVIDIEDFESLSDALFSRRLSQLFNTYLILTQTESATQGVLVKGMPLFEYSVTEPAQVSNLVHFYAISKPWTVVCFASCVVLLCSGVLSVVFEHLADGPEILGYASTAVRDSRLLELRPEAGSMSAMDLTKMMRGERLRYGVTHPTRKGQRLLGVGREEETEHIKNKFN